MTDVDVSKIKVGDVVGVRVVRTSDPAAYAIESGWGTPSLIHAEAIVSHAPAPRPALKVGDRVRNSSGVELEVVGPPRSSKANNGEPEIAIWTEDGGYYFEDAAAVETWERV